MTADTIAALVGEIGRCRRELSNVGERLGTLERQLQRLEGVKTNGARRGVVLEREAHRIRVGHRTLRLSRRQEFETLALLVERAGRIVSPTQIVRAVWGDEIPFGIGSKHVSHLICRVRRELRNANMHDLLVISTWRGMGYSCEGR